MQIPHDTAARLTNYALDKPKENETKITFNAIITLVALCHQVFSAAFLIVHGKTIEVLCCCTRCDVTKAIGECLERTFPTTIVALSAFKIEQHEVNL